MLMGMANDSGFWNRDISEMVSNAFTGSYNALKKTKEATVNCFSNDYINGKLKDIGALSLKSLIPGVIIGAGFMYVQTDGDCFDGSYNPNKIIDVQEKKLEDSDIEYTIITQEGGRRTEFLREGNTGQKLEDMHENESEGLDKKYESDRQEINDNYDQLKERAVKLSKGAWK